MKITKRDVKFLLMGALILFVVETLLGWNNVISDMRKGYTEAYKAAKK